MLLETDLIKSHNPCGKASWRVGEGGWGEKGECGQRDRASEPAASSGRAGGGQASPAGSWPPGPRQAAEGPACRGNCPLGAVQHGRVLPGGSAAQGGFRLPLTWPEVRSAAFADAARSEPARRRRAKLGACGSLPTRPRWPPRPARPAQPPPAPGTARGRAATGRAAPPRRSPSPGPCRP